MDMTRREFIFPCKTMKMKAKTASYNFFSTEKSMLVFMAEVPCGLVGGYQLFG
jgi:hypothetical protein